MALQVREQCQQQLELLHANVEEVQQAQQALAATSGVGRGADADLDVHARLEALGQDLDDVRGVTHRLERYVEQMLRQMLGSLNAGQAVDMRHDSGHMGFLEGVGILKLQDACMRQACMWLRECGVMPWNQLSSVVQYSTTVKAHNAHKIWQKMCIFRTGYLKTEQHLSKLLHVILWSTSA